MHELGLNTFVKLFRLSANLRSEALKFSNIGFQDYLE
jgi:hypothetical protein